MVTPGVGPGKMYLCGTIKPTLSHQSARGPPSFRSLGLCRWTLRLNPWLWSQAWGPNCLAQRTEGLVQRPDAWALRPSTWDLKPRCLALECGGHAQGHEGVWWPDYGAWRSGQGAWGPGFWARRPKWFAGSKAHKHLSLFLVTSWPAKFKGLISTSVNSLTD